MTQSVALMLDPEELLETARKRTGLSDFGPADFRAGFDVLVEALNADCFVAPDRFERLYERIQRLLINRLWMAKDINDHPEILDQEIKAPIIISSLPRTGSTKLHRLLGASGDFQTTPLWKVHMPSRIPGEPDGGIKKRIAITREHEKWMYATSPAIITGHPQFTEEPEEDQWLMEQSFRHAVLFGIFGSGHYLQWIMQADPQPTFDYFSTQLKYLQWQFPADRHKPWLIKSPTHFGQEPLLQNIFDQARYLVTHRDPAKCMPSITTTALSVRKLYSDNEQGADMLANIVGMFSHLAGGHMQWRAGNPDVPVLDLAFADIARNGLAVARKIYDFTGIEWTAASETRMLAWENENTAERHGKARYSAEAFDTTDDAVRLPFSAYIERYRALIG